MGINQGDIGQRILNGGVGDMNVVFSVRDKETEPAVLAGNYGIRLFDEVVHGCCIERTVHRRPILVPFSFHGDFPYGNISKAAIRRLRHVDHEVASDWLGNIDCCLASGIIRNHRRAGYKVPLVRDTGQFPVWTLSSIRQVLTGRNDLPLLHAAAGPAILGQPQSRAFRRREQPDRVVNCSGILVVNPNGAQWDVGSQIDPDPVVVPGRSRNGRQSRCRGPTAARVTVKRVAGRQVPSRRRYVRRGLGQVEQESRLRCTRTFALE